METDLVVNHFDSREVVIRKAGAKDGPSNPACGVLARAAYSTQRAWGLRLRRRKRPGLTSSATRDNTGGEKLNHERRDHKRLHVRFARAGLLYRDEHCRRRHVAETIPRASVFVGGKGGRSNERSS